MRAGQRWRAGKATSSMRNSRCISSVSGDRTLAAAAIVPIGRVRGHCSMWPQRFSQMDFATLRPHFKLLGQSERFLAFLFCKDGQTPFSHAGSRPPCCRELQAKTAAHGAPWAYAAHPFAPRPPALSTDRRTTCPGLSAGCAHASAPCCRRRVLRGTDCHWTAPAFSPGARRRDQGRRQTHRRRVGTS